MYDLLLINGRTIAEEQLSIAITDKKIKKIAPQIEAEATKTIDLKNAYVSAGWIDDHLHCYEKMTLYYDTPDKGGVESGVTTIIDAGTTGAENIGDFYQLAKQAKTNVFALLNISKWGIIAQDELADLSKIKENLVHETLAKFPDFVIGIKARMSKTVVGPNDIIPLDLAKKIQKANQNLPLMVHIGSAPPKLDEVLARMDTTDVLTHCFNGKPNGILDTESDTIKDFAWEAYQRGVVFDIGHGTDSFNFHVAETAFKEGLFAHTISTDLYHGNRENGPVYDMATTLEKMHIVGYSWREIIEKITVAPAKYFNLTTKGHLAEGYDADLTIFTIEAGQKILTDSNGFTRTATELIKPQLTVVGGEVYDTK